MYFAEYFTKLGVSEKSKVYWNERYCYISKNRWDVKYLEKSVNHWLLVKRWRWYWMINFFLLEPLICPCFIKEADVISLSRFLITFFFIEFRLSMKYIISLFNMWHVMHFQHVLSSWDLRKSPTCYM